MNAKVFHTKKWLNPILNRTKIANNFHIEKKVTLFFKVLKKISNGRIYPIQGEKKKNLKFILHLATYRHKISPSIQILEIFCEVSSVFTAFAENKRNIQSNFH